MPPRDCDCPLHARPDALVYCDCLCAEHDRFWAREFNVLRERMRFFEQRLDEAALRVKREQRALQRQRGDSSLDSPPDGATV